MVDKSTLCADLKEMADTMTRVSTNAAKSKRSN